MKNSRIVLGMLVLISAISLFQMSCRKKKGEPNSKICASKLVYAKKDTVMLENCSDNYTKQRWLLPDGTQSTASKVSFVPPTVGTYKFTLYVSNEDFIYDYESYLYVEVK